VANAEVRELLRWFKQRGWSLVGKDGRGHWVLVAPGGLARMSVASTLPGRSRTFKNTRAQAIRLERQYR